MLRRRWVRITAGTLTAVLLLLIGYLYLESRTISAKLAAEIAELDATDPGWRFDDILKYYLAKIPPDDKNPFVVVKAAIAKPLAAMQKLPEKQADWLPEIELNRRPMPRESALVGCVLYESREALELAGTLKHYSGPGGAAPKIAIDVISTPVQHISEMYRLSGLLAIDNLFHSLNADWPEAIASISNQMHLARSLGEEPFVASMMIRSHAFSNAILSLERMLALGEPPAESMDPLLSLLQSEDEMPHLEIVARGERAALHRMFDNLETGKDSLQALVARWGLVTGPIPIRLQEQVYRFMVKRDHREVLVRTTHLCQASKQPSHLRLAYVKSLGSKNADPGISRIMHLLYSIGWKDMHERLISSDLRFHTRLRCALVAIRCEQHRQKHGGWPTRPDLPLDPYTGKPLLYRLYSGGVVIYSPGLDGEDNDGNLAGKDDPGTDVGFRLWDSSRRNQE